MPDLLGFFTQVELKALYKTGVPRSKVRTINHRFGSINNPNNDSNFIGWDRPGRPIILIPDGGGMLVYTHGWNGEDSCDWHKPGGLHSDNFIPHEDGLPTSFKKTLFMREIYGGIRLEEVRQFMRSITDGSKNRYLAIAHQAAANRANDMGNHFNAKTAGRRIIKAATRILNIREASCEEPLTKITYFSLCEASGLPCVRSTLREAPDGTMLCEDEFNNNWITCQLCADVVSQSNSRFVHGSGTCCTDCVSNNDDIYECDNCGNFHYAADSDPDEITCPHCAPRSGATRLGNIQGYDTNVLNVTTKQFLCCDHEKPRNDKAAEPVWLGVELEVEPRKDGQEISLSASHEALNVNKKNIFAIFKRDSSLAAGGFEIVTVPASLDYHRKAWTEFFDTKNPEHKKSSASRMLKSWTGSNCGMHVHIGIAGFTPLQLGRFMQVFNEPDNGPFISSVAGRVVNRHSRYCPTEGDRNPKYAWRITQRGRKNGGKMQAYDGLGHHAATAISGRNGGKTIEVRVFKGNVAKAGFFKNLEFCHAAVIFAKETSNGAIKTADFLEWFNQPHIRGAYKYLWQWLIERGWLDTKHQLKEDGERYPNEAA